MGDPAFFSVPLGNNLFKEQIEATLGKSVGYIARGRPKQGQLGDTTIVNYSHIPPIPFVLTCGYVEFNDLRISNELED
jgi:hypothetical protein